MSSLFQCPMCEARVICQDVAKFRCPSCGFDGGNQLSLFKDGSIKYLGEFSPQKNAQAAYFYHQR